MTTQMSGVAPVVRTWSYYGGLDPVRTFRHGGSARAWMLMIDGEVGTVVETTTTTTTELKAPASRQVVMAPAQMASAPLEALNGL